MRLRTDEVMLELEEHRQGAHLKRHASLFGTGASTNSLVLVTLPATGQHTKLMGRADFLLTFVFSLGQEDATSRPRCSIYIRKN
jgi:hypothetical protein